jgi:hypothetical protein
MTSPSGDSFLAISISVGLWPLVQAFHIGAAAAARTDGEDLSRTRHAAWRELGSP